MYPCGMAPKASTTGWDGVRQSVHTVSMACSIAARVFLMAGMAWGMASWMTTSVSNHLSTLLCHNRLSISQTSPHVALLMSIHDLFFDVSFQADSTLLQ